MLGFLKKEVIGEDYLTRWHILPRNPLFNIYVHKFTGSDQPLPHCHPWDSISLLLKGSVREYYISDDYAHIEDKLKCCDFAQSKRLISAGEVTVRQAEFIHRLEIVDGPVWTIFVTFRRRRNWGFYTPKGWVWWADAIDVRGKLLDMYKKG